MAIANFTLTLRRTVFRPAAEDHRRCSKIVVIAILVLALALRVGWSLTRGTDAGAIDALPDQREYLDLGRSLLRDGRLAMVDPRFNDLVYAFRMPGYPLLCAACGGSVTAIRMVQALLDASTVLAVIWLARRWLSPRLSYLAGLAVALDPIYVYFSGLVLSETLFAAMLAWGAACLVHGASPLSREARGAHLVWAAGVVLLILSIYVRPSAIAFPVFLVAGAALVETRSLRFKSSATRLPVLTMVALATLVALLPWALRNRAVLGSTLFTTTNDGFTLHDGLNPDAVGSSDQSWIELLPLLPNLSELQRSAYLRERALTFARQHPMRALALVPQKLRRTW